MSNQTALGIGLAIAILLLAFIGNEITAVLKELRLIRATISNADDKTRDLLAAIRSRLDDPKRAQNSN
jgi:hypothetical protein